MPIDKAVSEEREPMGCRINKCPYGHQATRDEKHSLDNRFAILRRILFYLPQKKEVCFYFGKELTVLATLFPPNCLDHPPVPRGGIDEIQPC